MLQESQSVRTASTAKMGPCSDLDKGPNEKSGTRVQARKPWQPCPQVSFCQKFTNSCGGTGYSHEKPRRSQMQALLVLESGDFKW